MGSNVQLVFMFHAKSMFRFVVMSCIDLDIAVPMERNQGIILQVLDNTPVLG